MVFALSAKKSGFSRPDPVFHRERQGSPQGMSDTWGVMQSQGAPSGGDIQPHPMQRATGEGAPETADIALAAGRALCYSMPKPQKSQREKRKRAPSPPCSDSGKETAPILRDLRQDFGMGVSQAMHMAGGLCPPCRYSPRLGRAAPDIHGGPAGSRCREQRDTGLMPEGERRHPNRCPCLVRDSGTGNRCGMVRCVGVLCRSGSRARRRNMSTRRKHR